MQNYKITKAKSIQNKIPTTNIQNKFPPSPRAAVSDEIKKSDGARRASRGREFQLGGNCCECCFYCAPTGSLQLAEQPGVPPQHMGGAITAQAALQLTWSQNSSVFIGQNQLLEQGMGKNGAASATPAFINLSFYSYCVQHDRVVLINIYWK